MIKHLCDVFDFGAIFKYFVFTQMTDTTCSMFQVQTHWGSLEGYETKRKSQYLKIVKAF